jgi:hypothetical protein
MLELNLNAILKIIIYSVIFVIVNILLFSQNIKNVHVLMIFILILVLILKNSFREN